MISKHFMTRALGTSIFATGLTLASAPNAMTEPDDISIRHVEERSTQLKDGRLGLLGVNNFNVICPEGIFSRQDASNQDKQVVVELNSITMAEMAREHNDLLATRSQNPFLTQELLRGSQSFSLDTNGKFKQLNTMNSVIELAEDWAKAGKEPKGILPSDEAGMKRIKDHARNFCFGGS